MIEYVGYHVPNCILVSFVFSLVKCKMNDTYVYIIIIKLSKFRYKQKSGHRKQLAEALRADTISRLLVLDRLENTQH